MTGKRSVGKGAIGCLVIVLSVLVCGSGMFLTFDRVCLEYLPARLPLYPNATITFRTHNFITEWGMGNTVFILDTDDEPDAVRAWYGVHTGTFLRESLQNPTLLTDVQRRIARADVTVQRAEDGTGSMITLLGTCVNN